MKNERRTENFIRDILRDLKYYKNQDTLYTPHVIGELFFP